MAWFAIGYAHYLDGQFPAAISALQKAQPFIGELQDYTAYFIGSSYTASNSPEASLTYLRDFGTRYPDSVYANDAVLSYAKALMATNRPSEAVQVLLHRTGGGAEGEYLLGKAYVQNGQNRTGAEVFRRVYYNYATSPQADLAESDLKKIPEAASLPAGYSQRAGASCRRAVQRAALGPCRRAIQGDARRRSRRGAVAGEHSTGQRPDEAGREPAG